MVDIPPRGPDRLEFVPRDTDASHDGLKENTRVVQHHTMRSPDTKEHAHASDADEERAPELGGELFDHQPNHQRQNAAHDGGHTGHDREDQPETFTPVDVTSRGRRLATVVPRVPIIGQIDVGAPTDHPFPTTRTRLRHHRRRYNLDRSVGRQPGTRWVVICCQRRADLPSVRTLALNRGGNEQTDPSGLLGQLPRAGLPHEMVTPASGVAAQIGAEPRAHDPPENQSLYVQARGALRKELTAQLRRRQVTRRPRGHSTYNGQGQLRGVLRITERPPEAEDRAVPGHWEGDLLFGKGMTAVATLVERTSRYLMLVALPDGHRAELVADALADRITQLPTSCSGH